MKSYTCQFLYLQQLREPRLLKGHLLLMTSADKCRGLLLLPLSPKSQWTASVLQICWRQQGNGTDRSNPFHLQKGQPHYWLGKKSITIYDIQLAISQSIVVKKNLRKNCTQSFNPLRASTFSISDALPRYFTWLNDLRIKCKTESEQQLKCQVLQERCGLTRKQMENNTYCFILDL